jgi:hypothetical protein
LPPGFDLENGDGEMTDTICHPEHTPSQLLRAHALPRLFYAQETIGKYVQATIKDLEAAQAYLKEEI